MSNDTAMTFGAKIAAPLQRMESENLLAAVFPDQLACLEHIVGDREIPDHPLVKQTIDDCLTDAMDIEDGNGVIATVHKAVFSPLHHRANIDLAGGGRLEAVGNLIDKDFEIRDGGQPVARAPSRRSTTGSRPISAARPASAPSGTASSMAE